MNGAGVAKLPYQPDEVGKNVVNERLDVVVRTKDVVVERLQLPPFSVFQFLLLVIVSLWHDDFETKFLPTTE